MIIVIGPDATEEQKQAVRDKIIELDSPPTKSSVWNAR